MKMVTYFNAADMVDFGNFLIDKARRRRKAEDLMETSERELMKRERTLQGMLIDGVSHADFANWKTLSDRIRTAKGVVKAQSELSSETVEFLRNNVGCHREKEVRAILADNSVLNEKYKKDHREYRSLLMSGRLRLPALIQQKQDERRTNEGPR